MINNCQCHNKFFIELFLKNINSLNIIAMQDKIKGMGTRKSKGQVGPLALKYRVSFIDDKNERKSLWIPFDRVA